ncbi:MAG: hypothetical protein OXF62_19310 [Caldilineaceae bacterium]|nr:hypothetical protein [Caldilineaceae bacterium]
MSTMTQIWQELENSKSSDNGKDYNGFRQRYLKEFHRYTGRNVILYGSSWLHETSPAAIHMSQITAADFMSFKECVAGLSGDELDLILHSPGGVAEYAEQIVEYLRGRFRNVRVIVPHMAMSAGTLIACSANRIVMGEQAALGPIDPQMIVPVGSAGLRTVAAIDVVKQYEMERDLVRQLGKNARYDAFSQFGPDLVVRSERAIELSVCIAKAWLFKYMFDEEVGMKGRASGIANWLVRYNDFNSHHRCIFFDQLKSEGLMVERLKDCPETDKFVNSIFNAMNIMFMETDAVKVVENHGGQSVVSKAAS